MIAGAVSCEVTLVPEPDRAVDESVVDGLLSGDERRVGDRFTRDADRRAYRASHAALRIVLADRLGTAPGAIEFRRRTCVTCGEPHGKPFVDGPVSFSFSRTSGLCAVVVADGPTEVGIDVERRLDLRAAQDISGVLTPGERSYVQAARSPADATSQVWVRKEAAVKCIGVGLSVDLGSFAVRDPRTQVDGVPVWLSDLEPVDGVHGAVAACGGPPRVHVTSVSQW